MFRSSQSGTVAGVISARSISVALPWFIAVPVMWCAACGNDDAPPAPTSADAMVDATVDAAVDTVAIDTVSGDENPPDTSSSDGAIAPCVPPAYPSPTHAWGGACRTPADCPLPDNPTTFCEGFTGGDCVEKGGPDYAGEGLPCRSDPQSVGVMFDSFGHCLAACAADSGCRPGYFCADALGQSGALRACLPITDCEARGCNEGASGDSYRCEVKGAESACWVDACVGDPCAADPFSAGVCMSVGDGRQCSCVGEKRWDPQCQRCDELECGAEDLGVASGSSLLGSGDTCGIEPRFDPTARGCTGWDALGPEQLFRFSLPAQTSAVVTATPTASFDIALYVIEDCFDFEAQTCLAGRDMAGAESVRVTNDGTDPHELFAVVDGALVDSCGTFTIEVSAEPFVCNATDLGTFDGTPIERLDESNCSGGEAYDPGFTGCTGQHAAGHEQVYRLTIPAQTTVTVTLEPKTSFDASLYAIDTCGDYGAASCSAGADTGLFGATESITIENTDGAPRTYYVVADSFNVFSACGTYDLRVVAI